MHRTKLIPALIALLAIGLIAAGCGGDDDDDSSSGETVTVEEAPADDGSGSAPPEDAVPEDVPGNVSEAVQQCKDQVEASGLSGDAKANALSLCDDAGKAIDGN